jgi:uncharacterized membrane protein (UPF0127 family)
MQKKILIILLGLLVLFFIFIKGQSVSSFPGYKEAQLNLHGHNLRLYIADNDKTREQGLSGIKKLKDNEGMVFVFRKPDYYAFWMKDMNFPLDFIYVNINKVVDIKENISPQTYPQAFEPVGPSDKIIEVNVGTVQKLSIKKGDIIQLR